MTAHVNRADRAPGKVPQFTPGIGDQVDRPQTGHFKTRLVKRGPWVPALIYRPCPFRSPELDVSPDEWCWHLDRYPPLEAMINGEVVDVFRVWPYALPIDASEYAYMIAVTAHDVEHQPDGPNANPREPVDLSRTPALF